MVQLVPLLELLGFDSPPSELVGSIVTPSEIDYLALAIEPTVVVLYIWKFMMVFDGR